MPIRLSKISWTFLICGLFFPCFLNASFYLKLLPIDRMPDWVLMVLWPGVGFYMSTDSNNGPNAASNAIGFIMSVVANGLIYLLLGVIVSFSQRLISARISRRAA